MPSMVASLIDNSTSSVGLTEASFDLFTQQKRQTEKLKEEAQAIREARELEFLRSHKELEAAKMQQAIEVARLESKKRECEQGIERLRATQRQSEQSLQRLKQERESSRLREEETSRQLNQKLAQLELQREQARQHELEKIRRKIRDQTSIQHELASEKMAITSGRRENQVLRQEHEITLTRRESELQEKERKLNEEWEEIERRRLALEQLTAAAEDDAAFPSNPAHIHHHDDHHDVLSSPTSRFASPNRLSARDPPSPSHTHTSTRSHSREAEEHPSPSPATARPSLDQLRSENDALRQKITTIDREASLSTALVREREGYEQDLKDSHRSDRRRMEQPHFFEEHETYRRIEHSPAPPRGL